MLPYDKFLTFGPSALSEEELIAILLRTGAKGRDAVSLACSVLSLCGSERGILGLYHLSVEDLQKIEGIGEVKAVKLLAAAELSKRMASAKIRKDACLNTPELVAEAYMEKLRHLEQEQCIAVYLDSAECRIEDQVISLGSLNVTLISAREIFRRALRLNASSVIILHNHPSGNPVPSQQDILTTRKLREAAKILEIKLLDHIIIGDGTYYSLLKEGDL